MDGGRAQQNRRRMLPVLVGLGFFLALALIWAIGGWRAYHAVGKVWGIGLYLFPFVDTDTVLSAVRCANQGIDVYVANPCDPLARPFDYSPAWMALRIFPMTIGWLWPIGLLVGTGFFVAVLMMPAARTTRGAWLIALAVVSSASLFAVERGNNDLVLFLAAAGAATLVARGGAIRYVGYALALLAGLLKYYPLLLMAIAARERPGRLMATGAASVAVVGLFVLGTWGDLSRALALIPTGGYFGDMFGAVTVAGGLVQAELLPPALGGIVHWGMAIAALAIGARYGLRPGLAARVADLDQRESAFLLVGALLIIGCFFSAQNIGYRAVHLILTLPALLVLDRRAAAAAVVLLWAEGWRHLLSVIGKALGPAALAFATALSWIIRECLWWWLVTLLLACVIAWLARSTAARALFPRLPGRDVAGLD